LYRDVDLVGLDIGHQAAQRGPIHVAAGVAAVLVIVGDGDPALVTLV